MADGHVAIGGTWRGCDEVDVLPRGGTKPGYTTIGLAYSRIE